MTGGEAGGNRPNPIYRARQTQEIRAHGCGSRFETNHSSHWLVWIETFKRINGIHEQTNGAAQKKLIKTESQAQLLKGIS